jgi:PUA domain protein
MAPGLTHPTGGKVAAGVAAGEPVAVYVESKQHAVAVGVAAQSSDSILQTKADVAVHNAHHLGDGLWWLDTLTQDKVALAAPAKKKPAPEK